MRLIIGLGNPGKKYIGTRHNIGFSCLEYIRQQWNFPPFRDNASYRAECSEGRLGTERILLARPRTFMNRSGDAVQKISQFYKLEPNHIAVIHDDLDISLGDVRESFGSRSAGHNGVEDIIGTLNTKEFFRFRIGIKTPDGRNDENSRKDTATFVLEPFSADEYAAIKEIFPNIAEKLRIWTETRS